MERSICKRDAQYNCSRNLVVHAFWQSGRDHVKAIMRYVINTVIHLSNNTDRLKLTRQCAVLGAGPAPAGHLGRGPRLLGQIQTPDLM